MCASTQSSILWEGGERAPDSPPLDPPLLTSFPSDTLTSKLLKVSAWYTHTKSGLACPSIPAQVKSSKMSNAVIYTSRLDVKYQIQLRQIQTAHEDDYYCLALFKMQRAMAVKLSEFSHFVCLDDKAKVPFGEPDQMMSTGVRNRLGIAAGGSRLLALDHDPSSKGSMTPSVVLECDIPELPAGSFYQGLLHVLVKDTTSSVISCTPCSRADCIVDSCSTYEACTLFVH